MATVEDQIAVEAGLVPVEASGSVGRWHLIATGRFRVGARSHWVVTGSATALLVAVTIVASLTVRQVIRGQEHRLLQERTTEVAAFLQTSISPVRAELLSAGASATVGGGSSALFTLIAKSLVQPGSLLAVAQQRGGHWQALATYGSAAIAPQPDAIATAIGARVLAASSFVTGIQSADGRAYLTIGMRIPVSTPTIAFVQSPLTPTRSVPAVPGSPFKDLNVAVYASPTADATQLLIVSGSGKPRSGESTQKTLPAGAETWLVVVSARQPLVGAFAAAFAWVVLVGGLVVALLVGMLAYVLARRRAYAVGLVEERTRSLRASQQEAETANGAKSEFISRMSHELRTPLNAVLGFSQLLDLADHLDDDQRRAVAQINRGGQHLLGLINEVLDIAQVESGRLALSPEAVLVADLLQESIELLQPVAATRDIHVATLDAHSCRKYVFADRQCMRQILLNVVGNAIKYNRHGGSVSISCTQVQPTRLRILVADTGPGIEAAQLHNLFVPFERLGAEQTTIQGTGIGLVLSRKLAEAMGGSVDIEHSDGRGTTFWIELPLVEGPVNRYERIGMPTVRENQTPDEPEAQPTILHIEDNLSNVELMQQILNQRPGIRLLPVMQGRLGLDLARQNPPMLILLDVNLPDMPGEEVLTALRDDPRTSRVPVVVVSADATQRQIQRLLATGATAYLTKPIDVRQLLAIIDDAAARTFQTTAMRQG